MRGKPGAEPGNFLARIIPGWLDSCLAGGNISACFLRMHQDALNHHRCSTMKKFICIQQTDSSDCGAACLASIAWHYGMKMPLSTIRSYAKTDARGTNVLGVVMAAEELGFAAKGVRGNAQALMEIPLPAIAHVVMENGLQHFVVLYRISQKLATVADPAKGLSTMPVELFMKEWTGVLILLAPGPKFERGDYKESNWSRFMKLVKPYPRFIAESLIGAVMYTVLGFTTALYIQYLVDDVFPDMNRQLLTMLSLAMIVLTGFRIFFGWARQILLLQLSQKIDATLVLGYYQHILKLPQTFFDTRRIGEIISRVNDAMKIRYAISSVSLTIIVDGLVVAGGFLFMFLYSWKLAAAATIMIPALLFLFFLLKDAIRKTEREIMERSSELQAHLVSSINAASTIKVFQAEPFNNLATERSFVQTLRAVWRSGIQGLINANGSEVITSLMVIGLLWMGGSLVMAGELSVGELMSFYTLIGIVTAPAGRIVGIHQTIQDALIAADRLFEIMAIETEETVHRGKFPLGTSAVDAIRFQHVSFRYGARAMVLDDASFTIPSGTMTAIVGESGSGKSTAAKLLSGLYPCTQGEIMFGSLNINDIPLHELRSYCGVVPQDIELFHGSVVSNIAYGDTDPDYQAVARACALSGAERFIRNLPHTWDTVLGEHGATLSGGERQRLALARALYRRPRLLILDEATSSLDSESECIIQEALRQLLGEGMTILAIAHRLSTIMNADKIIVLEKGRVVEEGTHQSLLSRKAKYSLLWKRQVPAAIPFGVRAERNAVTV